MDKPFSQRNSGVAPGVAFCSSVSRTLSPDSSHVSRNPGFQKMMIFRYVLTVALAFSTLPAPATESAGHTLLRQALDAQGGEKKLRAIHSVSFQGTGYRNMIEQSERPEGPYFVTFFDLTEQHDQAHGALCRQSDLNTPGGQRFRTALLVAGKAAMKTAGSRQAPGNARDVRTAMEELALAPERVLLTALDAGDAHREADIVLQGVRHNVIRFTLDGATARLYLNQNTHLPTSVEYDGPLAATGYAMYLGDVTMRIFWSYWRLDKNGLRYPMQWDVQVNGMPAQMMMLRELRFDEPSDQNLTIPPEVAALYDASAPARTPDNVALGKDIQAIAPGVTQIRNSWNVTIVDQGDGLVVLEAPISSQYSEKILAEAALRFPRKRIKALISTSDSWPHLAGIREFAARGIPIYAVDLSEPIIRRTLDASYASHPDMLHKAPRTYELHLVSRKTSIGAGPNRIKLYPLRGETSERQMMVYMPGHRLLYGSDPFQRTADGHYTDAQAVSELLDAVTREHLEVDRFFMMHSAPRPFSELKNVLGEFDQRTD
jgi:hypothetical protein